MKGSYFFILVSVLAGMLFIDVSSFIFTFAVYCAGLLIIRFISRNDKIDYYKIFTTLFFTGALYMFLCYGYMSYNKFSYLFSFDTINYFLPETERFLKYDSLMIALSKIWDNFSLFGYFKPGYFTYAVIFGFAGKALGVDLYFVQQVSSLLIYAFSGIFVFRIFLKCGFYCTEASKNTIIVMICSIVFFYSSQIMRDIHIMLLFLAVIYYMLDSYFRISSVIKIFVLSLICCTFRIESGLFLFFQVPVYLWLNLNKSNRKNWVFTLSIIIFFLFILWIIPKIDSIFQVFEKNKDYYIEDISQGSGIIGTLQRIPIVGDVLSIIYNMLQPVPFWSRFSPPAAAKYGVEAYNIMRFPVAISATFTFFSLMIFFSSVFSKTVRARCLKALQRPFKIQLLMCFIFLYLQAAVVTQRRLMAYYIIFYVLCFLIWKTLTALQKKTLISYSVLFFIILQLVGFILFK